MIICTNHRIGRLIDYRDRPMSGSIFILSVKAEEQEGAVS